MGKLTVNHQKFTFQTLHLKKYYSQKYLDLSPLWAVTQTA
jgi:hypothetical protein